jgi:hypothetical protein
MNQIGKGFSNETCTTWFCSHKNDAESIAQNMFENISFKKGNWVLPRTIANDIIANECKVQRAWTAAGMCMGKKRISVQHIKELLIDKITAKQILINETNRSRALDTIKEGGRKSKKSRKIKKK